MSEEESVRQLISSGKSKTAVDRAKEYHRRYPSAASETLLIDSYAARIQSLLDQNLELEAKSLLQLVRERYPSAKERLHALNGTSAGSLEELLAPLRDAYCNGERRAGIEKAIQERVVDLAALSACPALPPDHPLRVSAAAIDRAFSAVTSGPVTDEQIALPEVSHRSPLAPWKMLVHAIASLYRGDDLACGKFLDAIKPGSVPSRLIPAMQVMIGRKANGHLTPAAAALIPLTTSSTAPLRTALERLDLAFEEDDDDSDTFKLVRSAVAECRRISPGQLEPLKRLIYVRGTQADLDMERLVTALGGMPRRDSTFLRMLAHSLEAGGDPDELFMASGIWNNFCERAVHEGLFPAKGVEAATVYLHMAGLLSQLPPKLLGKLEQSSQRLKSSGPETLTFPRPQELYERACAMDPRREAFSAWQNWAARQSVREGEDVAKTWNRARP
ncbi:MAG: hypothetical protein IAF94_17200, partial [Pirellulaceae bacterium]|nr:hypothetical protein [Pirellulaceae bacterium]